MPTKPLSVSPQALSLTTDNSQSRHWVDFIHGPAIAWLILAVSLLITLFAWSIADDYVNQRARERFEFQVNDAENEIRKRFASYEQVLRGGLGLFQATDSVSRSNWQKYINTLDIDTHYPGTLGIGYAQLVKHNELQSHIDSIRQEGFINYTLHPDTPRELYSSIIFLEPFNARNQRAFGFDMLSEKTRRTAMLRASDTGQTALSGKVTLVQETDTDIQAGFLVYVPHYRGPVTTLQQRRENISGFVYSALRIDDLMHGILGSDSAELDFIIYDGKTIDLNNLLYNSSSKQTDSAPQKNSLFSVTRQLEIAGHIWSVIFQSNQTFEKLTTSFQPTIVAASGLAIDLLLFNVILSLAKLRKRAQQLADYRQAKLSEREVQFKSITDSAIDGIITTDAQGLINYFNPAAQRLFGYSTVEVKNRPLNTLFTDQSQTTFNDFFLQKKNTDDFSLLSQQIEIEGRNKQQTIFPLELSLSSWFTNNKTNFTAIIRDITERKRIDAMKNEFISTVSHELRTPLTVINGTLSLLKSGAIGELEDTAMELVMNAHRNTETLTKLVNDLLDTEKLALGTIQFNYQCCHIQDLVTRAMEINLPFATQENKKLSLCSQCSTSVNVDPDRFNQVMTNLLTNAVKFSATQDTIELDITVTDNRVRIAITDHGVGISDEFRQRIFNKFAQQDSSDSRQYGGTGLGLSIVKFIVEKFGGSISFTSIPDEKTTFYFDLPVADPAELC